MTDKMGDSEFFLRYMMNAFEQERASYDEGNTLLGIWERSTNKHPKDWDKLRHLAHQITGDPDDPHAPDLFLFSIHAICGAEYHIKQGTAEGSYEFLIQERCIKIANGIEIIGNQVTCPNCAGNTIVEINSRLFGPSMTAQATQGIPREDLNTIKIKLEALWEEHLVLPHPECQSKGHIIGMHPNFCQRCGSFIETK